MSFSSWLYQPEPNWKQNLEQCHPNLFKELKMNKKEVEKILEKLEEYEVFKESLQR